MSAALELTARHLEETDGQRWHLDVVSERTPTSSAWQAEVRALVEDGDVKAARVVIESLPDTCDGPDRERWRRALEPARIIGTSPATGGNAASFEWLAREGEKYQGQWVFVDGDQFVDGDVDLRALHRRHADNDTTQWTLVWVGGPT